MPDPGTAIGVGSAAIGAIGSKKAGDASAQGAQDAIAEQRRQFDTALALQMPVINTGNVARSQLASILGLTVPQSGQTFGGSGPITPQTSEFNDLISVLQGANRPFGKLFLNRNLERLKTQTPAAAPAPASTPMSNDQVMDLISKYPGFQFAVDQARKASVAQASATGSSPISGNVLTALQGDIAGRVAMPAFSDYTNRLASLAGAAQTASAGAGNLAQATGANVGQLMQNAGDSRASGILGVTNSVLGGLGGILDEINRKRVPQPTVVP